MAAELGIPVSELSELRRKDIDLTAGIVRVRRALARVNGVFRVTGQASTEGLRDVSLPAPLVAVIEAHLREYVQPGRESLIFPSVRIPDRHLSPSVLNQMFARARATAGLRDLRMKDLRHSGVNLAAVIKPG